MPQDPLKEASIDIKNALKEIFHESENVISDYMEELSKQGGVFSNNPLSGAKTIEKLVTKSETQEEVREDLRLRKKSKAIEKDVAEIKKEEDEKAMKKNESQQASQKRVEKLRVKSKAQNIKEKLYNPKDKNEK